MFGRPILANGVLHARNTVYSLSPEIDASADPILRTSSLALAAFLLLFAGGFHDLLTPVELAVIAGFALTSLALGFSLARLVIIKPSLRGSDLSVAGYGTYRDVRRLAAEIVEAAHSPHQNHPKGDAR